MGSSYDSNNRERKLFWKELGFFVSTELVDDVCDFLLANGAIGVIVEDSGISSARFPEKDLLKLDLVKAFIQEDKINNLRSGINSFFEELREKYTDSEPPIIRFSNISKEELDFSIKRLSKPIEIDDDIVIKPYDLRNVKYYNKIELIIDPGMAFGTGLHKSTKLAIKGIKFALKRFEKTKTYPSKLLDVGTGTGLIAMLAVKLGFFEATGTEIDDISERVARYNVTLNKLNDKVFIFKKELSEIEEQFSVIVSHLYKDKLIEFNKELSKRLQKKGILILTGIRWNDAADIKSTFVRNNLEFIHVEYYKGHGMLIFEKR